MKYECRELAKWLRWKNKVLGNVYVEVPFVLNPNWNGPKTIFWGHTKLYSTWYIETRLDPRSLSASRPLVNTVTILTCYVV